MPHAPLQGPFLPPASAKPAKQLVIILHGWGADGHNLIDLGDMFAQTLPDAYFIAPNGPEICEVNPYGFQWFSLMNRDPAVMFSGAQQASGILNSFIDTKLAELSLPASALALVGFSQGTMLALHVALRRPAPPACVAGFSGALLGAEKLPDEIKNRPPVCLIHGQMDEVVPFGALRHAQEALQAAHVPVEVHARPMLGHSIDMPGLEIAAQFLKKNLV